MHRHQRELIEYPTAAEMRANLRRIRSEPDVVSIDVIGLGRTLRVTRKIEIDEETGKPVQMEFEGQPGEHEESVSVQALTGVATQPGEPLPDAQEIEVQRDEGGEVVGLLIDGTAYSGKDLDAWVSGDVVEGDEEENPERWVAYLERLELVERELPAPEEHEEPSEATLAGAPAPSATGPADGAQNAPDEAEDLIGDAPAPPQDTVDLESMDHDALEEFAKTQGLDVTIAWNTSDEVARERIREALESKNG